jgi:hypothetical protein
VKNANNASVLKVGLREIRSHLLEDNINSFWGFELQRFSQYERTQ